MELLGYVVVAAAASIYAIVAASPEDRGEFVGVGFDDVLSPRETRGAKIFVKKCFRVSFLRIFGE